jgi:hypothetical protein
MSGRGNCRLVTQTERVHFVIRPTAPVAAPAGAREPAVRTDGDDFSFRYRRTRPLTAGPEGFCAITSAARICARLGRVPWI